MTSSNSLYQVVWQTADTYLRGVVPRQNYGDYILPFTVLRRLECLLEPTKEQVLDALEKSPFPENLQQHIVRAQVNLKFFNTSSLSLALISASDDHVGRPARIPG